MCSHLCVVSVVFSCPHMSPLGVIPCQLRHVVSAISPAPPGRADHSCVTLQIPPRPVKPSSGRNSPLTDQGNTAETAACTEKQLPDGYARK